LHFQDKDLSDASAPDEADGAIPSGDDGVGVGLPTDDSAVPELDSSPPTDGTGADDTGAADVEPDGDGAVNPCSGKANGFQYQSGDPASLCCNQTPVKTNADGNCGACGISCPSGFTCGEVVTNQWGCHCATNASCQSVGYGAIATCYDDGTNTYCNCQCPGGAATCTNQCIGGATCYNPAGQNYCGYP
jgi:hypothetical protein